MKRLLLGTAFVLLSLINVQPLQAQRRTLEELHLEDTTVVHVLRLRDGSQLVGHVRRLSADSVTVEIRSTSVTVARGDVREAREMPRSQVHDGDLWFPNPHSTRLLFSPTAFPIEKITFIAGFKPQANLPFVGVYVAQERGYFKAKGLEVAIQHAVSGEHVQLLATGRAQFSTGSGGDILKRVSQADVPLVSIALIGQRDEQAFAVRADSPISTLKDWEGKLVGYKSTPSADYLALLKIGGVVFGMMPCWQL